MLPVPHTKWLLRGWERRLEYLFPHLEYRLLFHLEFALDR